VRTLVISDLHLGTRVHHDVLRSSVPLDILLRSLDDVDRLVLLGDTFELISRHPRRSLAAAEPVIRAIGKRMPSREVVLVPGNHDGPLIRAWIRVRGATLTNDSQLDPAVTHALQSVVSWLHPARVRVHYPGVWLGDRIYATHGHYLDHHLIPQSPIGLPRGALGGRPHCTAGPFDYEHGRIRSHHTRDTVAGRGLQRSIDGAANALRVTILPHVPRVLMNVGMTPLSAAAADLQMRHGALPAMARVLGQLGIEADWVIFGHVHRLGPLDSDRAEQWRSRTDGTRLLNSGSWLYEPVLVDRATPPHPYWPGGAVLIEPGADPRAVSLLDGLELSQLRPPASQGGRSTPDRRLKRRLAAR
jgi:UDP-2,3-diacylglucosamine pyrophosphatase LpxH